MKYRIEQLKARLLRILHRIFVLYLLMLAVFVLWDVMHPTATGVINLAEGACMLSLYALNRWNGRRGPNQSLLLSRLDVVLTYIVACVIILTHFVF